MRYHSFFGSDPHDAGDQGGTPTGTLTVDHHNSGHAVHVYSTATEAVPLAHWHVGIRHLIPFLGGSVYRTALATPLERSIMGGHLSIDFSTFYLYEATPRGMPSKPHGTPQHQPH